MSMKTLTSVGPIMLTLAAFGVAPPIHAADVSQGAQLYAMHCTSCHGRSGVPVMPGSPNFARSEGLMRPDLALVASIRTGKNAMPGYVGILKDREILDVIAYIRTLQR